ncbi:MAG: multidrug transporter [Anaerolineaceae bacterium 4572_78]|nr:MAG: multidrug transporter [Anaerolineaceae bacterium 4572_78]
MIKIILREPTHIYPFFEPARDLRILDKPLWLHHRDILSAYCSEEREYKPGMPIQDTTSATIIYRDNLYFDEASFKVFIEKARKKDVPCQIAFAKDDKSITNHAIHLQSGIRLQGDVYVADLYYYPNGYSKQHAKNMEPIVVDTDPQEVGYYHVPTYMAYQQGDLIYQVPHYPFLSIENWVHIFLANTAFGLFAQGIRIEAELDSSLWFLLKVLFSSLIERKQFIESSQLVRVGKNCQIDPAAVIQGPTIIGDNVTIGAGVAINSCFIGDNVNITQGCQLNVSVIGSGTFLPFRASLFMTTLMENGMVAQNTCLQMCVIGRNTFIGAGNTFTDFNLVAKPIRTLHNGKLVDVMQPVLGGCVGHNCRIGSGHVFFPARIIESDVVLFAKQGRHVIDKNITFADSDHHSYPGEKHIPLYQSVQQSER